MATLLADVHQAAPAPRLAAVAQQLPLSTRETDAALYHRGERG